MELRAHGDLELRCWTRTTCARLEFGMPPRQAGIRVRPAGDAPDQPAFAQGRAPVSADASEAALPGGASGPGNAATRPGRLPKHERRKLFVRRYVRAAPPRELISLLTVFFRGRRDAGRAALILTLSMMNGFEKEVRRASWAPPLPSPCFRRPGGALNGWEALRSASAVPRARNFAFRDGQNGDPVRTANRMAWSCAAFCPAGRSHGRTSRAAEERRF